VYRAWRAPRRAHLSASTNTASGGLTSKGLVLPAAKALKPNYVDVMQLRNKYSNIFIALQI